MSQRNLLDDVQTWKQTQRTKLNIQLIDDFYKRIQWTKLDIQLIDNESSTKC